MYRLFIKRLVDLIISLVGVLVMSPVFLMLSIALAIANQGSPFFLQERPGKKEKLFKIIKFKTMNDKRDQHGDLLPDMQRITPIGSLVRKYSLDELLQLINVLKGDMSLIGPRPLLTEYLTLYNEKQRRRHDIRPGITGWAQINGRNALNWSEKFELDVWYVENYNFRLDIKIVFITVLKVFKTENINESTTTTIKKFEGN